VNNPKGLGIELGTPKGSFHKGSFVQQRYGPLPRTYHSNMDTVAPSASRLAPVVAM